MLKLFKNLITQIQTVEKLYIQKNKQKPEIEFWKKWFESNKKEKLFVIKKLI